MRRIFYTETITINGIAFKYEKKQTKHGWSERVTTFDVSNDVWLHMYSCRHPFRFNGLSLMWQDVQHRYTGIDYRLNESWFNR